MSLKSSVLVSLAVLSTSLAVAVPGSAGTVTVDYGVGGSAIFIRDSDGGTLPLNWTINGTARVEYNSPSTPSDTGLIQAGTARLVSFQWSESFTATGSAIGGGGTALGTGMLLFSGGGNFSLIAGPISAAFATLGGAGGFTLPSLDLFQTAAFLNCSVVVTGSCRFNPVPVPTTTIRNFSNFAFNLLSVPSGTQATGIASIGTGFGPNAIQRQFQFTELSRDPTIPPPDGGGTAVPEPNSALLAAMAVGIVGLYKRRSAR